MNLRSSSTAKTILLAGLIVLLGCTRTRSQPPALPGNPAPGFSLKAPDGRTVTLADLAGKAIVMDFWATWCGPCKSAVAELEELHRTYGDRGVVVIGISVNKESDAAARVKEFAARQGMSYLLLIDDGSAYKSYGISRIPATFVIDRNHIIRTAYPGFRPGMGKDIAGDLDSILSSR